MNHAYCAPVIVLGNATEYREPTWDALARSSHGSILYTSKLEDALQFLAAVPGLSSRPMQMKTTLEIGSLHIPCVYYGKVISKQKNGSYTTYIYIL